MKKTTVSERLQNAYDAFFETGGGADDNLQEINTLTLTSEASLLKNEEAKLFSRKADLIVKILKQIFLLLPGVFILYFGVFAAVYFYHLEGLNLQMLFWLSAGVFMTWAGSGSLKETKKLFVPLLIITISLVLAAVFSVFSESLQPDLYFFYSIYLFPLILIAVKLAGNWLSDKEKIS